MLFRSRPRLAEMLRGGTTTAEVKSGYGLTTTFPYSGSTSIETIPYSKDIGGLVARDEDRIAFDEQPDWVVGMGAMDELA